MKMLKSALLGVFSVIIAFIGISFLLPSNFYVESSIELKCSPKEAFTQINILENWQNWAFDEEELKASLQFSGSVEGKGAIYEWTNQGAVGRVEIIASQPNTLVEAQSLSEQNTRKIDMKFMIKEEDSNTTIITWQQSGKIANTSFLMRYINAFGILDKALTQNMDNRLKRFQKFCTK